jgi:hypothetical protein
VGRFVTKLLIKKLLSKKFCEEEIYGGWAKP